MKKTIIIGVVLFLSCDKREAMPKPIGQLRLEYPNPNYTVFSPQCHFQFEYSNFSKIEEKDHNKCWFNINYPTMKSSIYITYTKIDSNITDLLKESQKLVYEHTIKASGIESKNFEYPEKKVYGSLYRLEGESASNLQFHITDSVNHFLSGNVYFETTPKPDSLRPAVDYIEKDVINLVETTTWK